MSNHLICPNRPVQVALESDDKWAATGVGTLARCDAREPGDRP